MLLNNFSPSLKAFSILSEAKDDDTRKRKVLMTFYTETKRLLDKIDDHLFTLLQRHVGNFNEDIKRHKENLEQKEYFLLVAGKW